MTTEPPTRDRKRVVILGAGPAGLSAAYGLSCSEELRRKYDVVVYQLGWRAGGKVTSGRRGPEQRVVQNGTHYVFGCYDNTFRVVRDAYRELDARDDTSFGTYEEAFLPLSFVGFEQEHGERWQTWPVLIPTNDLEPGVDTGAMGLAEVVSFGVQALAQEIGGWRWAQAVAPTPAFARAAGGPRSWPWKLRAALSTVVDRVSLKLGTVALRTLRLLLGVGPERWLLRAVARLLEDVRGFAWALLGPAVESDLDVRRQWMLLDMGCTTLVGIIRDDAFAPGGMAALDRYDYREWLARHGARPLTTEGPLATAWYDSIASYEGGDAQRPNVSAGVTLAAILNAAVGYKGAFAYQASREIGETVMAPLFELLRLRGVRFAFFEKVIDVLPDGDRIGEIRLETQAQLSSGDPYSYDPFVTVKGRKAWPDRPRYDQIADAGRIEDVDLEDFYSSFEGQPHELLRGRDFDEVVYALPVDTIPFYCKSILAERKSWRDMVAHVRGIDTRSLWLYFYPDLAAVGWPYPKPVVTTYALPLATWEDTTYLVPCEDWPEGYQPGMIASLFGPLPGPEVAPPPGRPDGYPARQLEAAKEAGLHFATRLVGGLWPKATSGDSGCVDWNLLVDLEDRQGEKRFAFQGVRANFGPYQRYTLARSGTLRYRLRTDESGYRNLYLAGDWIRNGADVGCIEGAVAGGLDAARAISGQGRIDRLWPNTGL